jgi:hypothetical protein
MVAFRTNGPGGVFSPSASKISADRRVSLPTTNVLRDYPPAVITAPSAAPRPTYAHDRVLSW